MEFVNGRDLGGLLGRPSDFRDKRKYREMPSFKTYSSGEIKESRPHEIGRGDFLRAAVARKSAPSLACGRD